MYHKILVPLDGSSLAESALTHAEALAQCLGSTLLLVRVCPPISSAFEFYTFGEERVDDDCNRDLQAQAEKKAEAYLACLQEKLQLKNIKSCAFVPHDAVPEAIVDIAETEGVDLILMSTHGYSGLGRWAYGSVAVKVLQAAPCPVFLTRVKREK